MTAEKVHIRVGSAVFFQELTVAQSDTADRESLDALCGCCTDCQRDSRKANDE